MSSSVASADAPLQLKEFLTSITWDSKDEASVDTVVKELVDNDIVVPGNITQPSYEGSIVVSYRLCPNCPTSKLRT